MQKLYLAALGYLLLGLTSGVYYREVTRANAFTGDTQLSVVHTHLLALGTLFFLVVMALEKVFSLSDSRLFGWFFWTYHVGLLWTVAFLAVNGTRTVHGTAAGPALAGMAGLGHVILSAALVLFFVCLGRRTRGPAVTG